MQPEPNGKTPPTFTTKRKATFRLSLTNAYHKAPSLLAQQSGTRFFGEKGKNCLRQRSCEFFVRPKNRVERGKFGAAKPATAIAFLLLTFLWRSKEK